MSAIARPDPLLLEEEQDNEQNWRQPEHRYGDEIPKIISH
jgi:hypothetical protein